MEPSGRKAVTALRRQTGGAGVPPPSGALYNGTLLLWSLSYPSRPFYYHTSSLQTESGCRSPTIQLIKVDRGKTKYFISSYILSAVQVENGTKFLSPRQKNFERQIKYSLRLRHQPTILRSQCKYQLISKIRQIRRQIQPLLHRLWFCFAWKPQTKQCRPCRKPGDIFFAIMAFLDLCIEYNRDGRPALWGGVPFTSL